MKTILTLHGWFLKASSLAKKNLWDYKYCIISCMWSTQTNKTLKNEE